MKKLLFGLLLISPLAQGQGLTDEKVEARLALCFSLGNAINISYMSHDDPAALAELEMRAWAMGRSPDITEEFAQTVVDDIYRSKATRYEAVTSWVSRCFKMTQDLINEKL